MRTNSMKHRHKQKTNGTLIPIKGVSKKMQEKLSRQKIFDIPSLLSHCKTQTKRNELANQLEIKPEYVNCWVKQADLWKVEGMTADMAYLLVQAGFRSVFDLSRANAKLVYEYLKSLQASQPEFILMSLDELKALIDAAGDIFSTSGLNINHFKANLKRILYPRSYIVDNPEEILDANFEQIIKRGISRNISNDYGFEDLPPYHLFTDSSSEEAVLRAEQKMAAAWKDIFEMDCTLPLPKIISGYVKQRSIIANTKAQPFEGVNVEIDGVVSPAEDKTEAANNPSCITDANGRFMITMPERYCFKESVKIIISNQRGRQEFIMNSTDVINAVKEKEVVNALQSILVSRIEYRSEYLSKQSDIGVRYNEPTYMVANDTAVSTIEYPKKAEYDSMLEAFKSDFAYYINKYNLNGKILAMSSAVKDEEDDIFDNAMQFVFNKILGNATLEARLKSENDKNKTDGEEESLPYFLVIKEIFRGENIEEHKSLPSVKLMGDDENAVILSTDTAPSRMFTYSMLQRLIEPKLSSNGTTLDRKELSVPVDIAEFKDKMCKDPENYPQMSTLGLGYQLNMHQAWVPDGFALGDLLYSLILAPGEEQRLVVRENKQSYQILDTASGTDAVSEDYSTTQSDDTSAVYNYAVNQMMDASSSFKSKSSGWSVGGSLSGFYQGCSLALTGGYSSSKSSGSAKAHQSNSHDEASAASQFFQQNIKTSSNRLAQAKRISMSTASSDVSESVATKIIANHNHSHAMTIQYWEVMRRYKLETAVDSVELVLFVPLKPIKFLGNESEITLSTVTPATFTKERLMNRYSIILKHANALEYALPWKYRIGLTLMKKYASYPKWSMESSDISKVLTIEFTGSFFDFDNLSVDIILKNGKGNIAGDVNFSPISLTTSGSKLATTQALKDKIRRYRDNSKTTTVSCSFTLPVGTTEDDIRSIRISHTCEAFYYRLYADESSLTDAQAKAWSNYLGKEWDFAKDDKSSGRDLRRMAHYLERLPEAFKSPEVSLSPSEIKRLGAPRISLTKASVSDKKLTAYLTTSSLSGSAHIIIESELKTLKRTEFERMEETFHHIVTDTLHYSQVVWGSLSSDERALMLDQYTIQMDYSKLRAKSTDESKRNNEQTDPSTYEYKQNNRKTDTPIPLLNCVNIRKVLGFYGNCMLLPFTFPEDLAGLLGRSAAEVQDQLYRYHTNSFRAPTTVISIPTRGMIGEAVLGQTNVSEPIDLTRFWNWQDSPIDKIDIDSSYLNGADYLANKNTKDITSMGLQGATATTPVTVQDLLTAMVNKQTPQFENLTGQNQLAQLIGKNTDSATTGRDNVVNQSTSMVNKALDVFSKQEELKANVQKELELEKIRQAGSNSNNGIQRPQTGGGTQSLNPSAGGGGGTQRPSTDKNGDNPPAGGGVGTQKPSVGKNEDNPPVGGEQNHIEGDDSGIDDDVKNTQIEEKENDSTHSVNELVDGAVTIEKVEDIFSRMKDYIESNPAATPEAFLKEIYNINYNDSSSLEKDANNILSQFGESVDNIITKIFNIQ